MVTDYSLSADQASKLVSLTRDNATNIKNSIDYLGNIHKIAPAAIAADLADNTELFALYAKKGGGNIIRAAIAAKELGMGLSEVGSIANKLLDIESSIAAEMEVSILLGRQINLDKARQLALTNDLDGMMEEITNQLGNQNE
jgi:hypothetical protein